MIRINTLTAIALAFLGGMSLTPLCATETVSPPDNSNGEAAYLIVEKVPEYLYMRTKGLVPVHFKVVGFNDRKAVTFQSVIVDFYIDWKLVYTEVISLYSGGSDCLTLNGPIGGSENPNRRGTNGMGNKGNGTGKRYIAWLDNARMFQVIPKMDAKNGIWTKGNYFTVTGYVDGMKLSSQQIPPAPIDVFRVPGEGPNGTYSERQLNQMRCAVKVYGDQTVNVVNIDHSLITGKDEDWSINAGSETMQEIRAKNESAVCVRRESMPVLQVDPWLTPDNSLYWRHFKKEDCYAWKVCRVGESNAVATGSVSLTQNPYDADQMPPPLDEEWVLGGNTYGGNFHPVPPNKNVLEPLVAESLGGGVGTYFGVSYGLDYLEPINGVGMNLWREESADLTVTFCKNAIIDVTLHNATDCKPSLSLSAFISGVLWFAETLANPPAAATVAASFWLNLGASSAAMFSAFSTDGVTVGQACVIIEAAYLKALPSDNPQKIPPVQLDNFSTKQLFDGSGQKITCQQTFSPRVGNTNIIYLNINLTCKLRLVDSPPDGMFSRAQMFYKGSNIVGTH